MKRARGAAQAVACFIGLEMLTAAASAIADLPPGSEDAERVERSRAVIKSKRRFP